MKLRNLQPYFAMKLKALRYYLNQFGRRDAVRYWIAQVVQERFDPHLIPSYSQTGEDRIIMHLLSSTKKGFYVDVGCNHPQHRSNTFELYKKGWTGISIDANQKLIQKHFSTRPNDISIATAVSDREGEALFTEFSEDCVSSLSAEHVKKWSARCEVVQQTTIATTTLTRILKEHHVPCEFELLSIDVEGHDFAALKSLDLKAYRPKLIVIEISQYELTNPASSEIYTYLIEHDYCLIGYVIVNAYFVARETVA
ncbi:MAG TPA: FkbM family methyltransferase [Leptolyngbya sp.]|nr:FkbM family methyltransferase [Leptolyngbya sp.]